jgi:hypothetical protein
VVAVKITGRKFIVGSIKRILVLASASLLGLALSSSAALADPIGGPWVATGTLVENYYLSGSNCSLGMAGDVDGNSATIVTQTRCNSPIGTPSPQAPWAIAWNASDTGGTMAYAVWRTFPGARCLYTATVPFTYSLGTLSFSGTVFGPPPCGGRYGVDGRVTL